MSYILGRQQASISLPYISYIHFRSPTGYIYLEEGNWAREVEEAHILTLVKDQPSPYIFHTFYVANMHIYLIISILYILGCQEAYLCDTFILPLSVLYIQKHT